MPDANTAAKAKAVKKPDSADGNRRQRGFASRLLIGLTSAVCILLFQNCGTDFVALSDDELASLGAFVCSPNIEENYRKTYKAFARKNCVGCHDSIQSPKFALADTTLAYSEFVKTNQDTFFEYGTNASHGGGAGGDEHIGAIINAQTRFDSCKNGGLGTPTDIVTARTRPLILNATANVALRSYTTLDTDLEFGGTNLGGAQLHFQVRIDTTQQVPTYFISRPSLQTGTATVAVKSLTIKINGVKISTATAFVNVDRTINPGTNPLNGQTPNGNLSLGLAVFEYPPAIPATDTIQFEFEYIRAQ